MADTIVFIPEPVTKSHSLLHPTRQPPLSLRSLPQPLPLLLSLRGCVHSLGPLLTERAKRQLGAHTILRVPRKLVKCEHITMYGFSCSNSGAVPLNCAGNVCFLFAWMALPHLYVYGPCPQTPL